MRLEKLILSLLLLAFALGAPLLAEEIVFFTNGTTMPVRSHQVKEGMIYVDLGSDNFIAFPEGMVEKIEDAGREVYIKPSYNGANVANGFSSGPNDGTYPVSARDQVPASVKRRRAGKNAEEYDASARYGGGMPTGEDEHGLAVAYPLANHGNKSAQKIAVTGRVQSLQGDPRMRGAERRGDKWVMDGTTGPKSRSGFEPTRITLRTTPPPASSDAGGAAPGNSGAAPGNDGAASGNDGAGPASNDEGDSDG